MIGGPMAILTTPSPAARTSLIYITIGALTEVWSGIWYSYLRRTASESDFNWYTCYGFLLTGLVLLIIGLAVWRIVRSCAHAGPPPREVNDSQAKTDQEAAGPAHTIFPGKPS